MDILCTSDVALNAIKAQSAATITNKLSDYFCCGLPILSCQEDQEVKMLLALGGGRNYLSNDHNNLADNLLFLAENRDVLENMSSINKKIAEEKFFRKTSYKCILKLINRLLLES